MKMYYLQDGQNNIGPFNLEELKERKITKNTSIWYEGLSDWTTAGNIEELKIILTETPPPLKKSEPPVFKKEPRFNLFQKIGFAIVIFFLVFIIFSNFNNNANNNDASDSEIIEEAVDTAAVSVANVDDLTTIRNKIESLIGVSSNKYTVEALGGISNLDIIVTNNSDYMMNSCVVEVRYIQENGDTFQNEFLTFQNIPAHQDKSISAPDSVRGLSVEVSVISIKSSELNLCFDGTVAPEVGNPDPFKCQ